jgi:membrane protein YdbS with pleckstrin-like domain
MRLVPQDDVVPASVSRYLLPRERKIVAVHQHPVALIGPVFLSLVGLALAGWLSNSVAHGDGTAILTIWLAWVVLLLLAGRQIAAWPVTYFAVTNERMLIARGVFVRRVSTMPLDRATDISFRRSVIGRLMGYGTLIAETSGPRQPFHQLKYVPYPEQLYLEIFDLLLSHAAPQTVCPTCEGRGTIPDPTMSSDSA